MKHGWDTTKPGFESTRWTIVGALRDGDQAAQQRALRTLTDTYWPAIYAWARLSGIGREEAAEFTQAFFVEKIFSGLLFAKADPARGKLRTYLLTAAKNFDIDRHRKSRTRGGANNIPFSAFEHEEMLLETTHARRDPDDFFHRRWMLAVLEEALARARAYYLSLGKEKHWVAFERRVLSPSRSGLSPAPCDELAKELGFQSAAHVASAVQVVKKRLRVLLREIVSEASIDPDDVDNEIAVLSAMIAG